MPQVLSVRPVFTPFCGVNMSVGIEWLNVFWISSVIPNDHLPCATLAMKKLENEKLALAGPPQRSDAAAVKPVPPLAPGAPALGGAMQPVVSPGPLPRKSLDWKYLYAVNAYVSFSVHFRASSFTCPSSKSRLTLGPVPIPKRLCW